VSGYFASAVARPEFIRTAQFHHAQAAVWDDRLELAGRGGWGDNFNFPPALVDEIAQTFLNVDAILRLADAGWDRGISVVSYHVDLNGHQDLVNQTMGQQFQHFTRSLSWFLDTLIQHLVLIIAGNTTAG